MSKEKGSPEIKIPGSFPTSKSTSAVHLDNTNDHVSTSKDSSDRASLRDTLLMVDEGSKSPKRRFALSPQRIMSSISRATSPIKRIPTPKLTTPKFPSAYRSISQPSSNQNSIKSPLGGGGDPGRQSIEGISKSFVSFLTTASIYAGFQDIDEDDDQTEFSNENEQQDAIPESLRSIDSYDTSADEFAYDEPDQEREGYTQEDFNTLKNDSRSVSPNDVPDTTLRLPEDTGAISSLETLPMKRLQKVKSRFELSVVKRMSTNDSDQADLKRAVALSTKLKKTFDITDNDEFVGDFPCWLMGDVLLQGHLYITKMHILFFAFLPKKQGSVLRSGTLTTKSYPSMREHRKWAVLKDSTFSIYSSSTDLYFPNLVIDLRTALRAEIAYSSSHEQIKSQKPVWIRIITESRTHSFMADTLDSARAWVSGLKKQIFASKNKGDQVAINIPLQNILDLELTSVIGVTKNLRIKVIESADSYAIDDYFLMFFSRGDSAVKVIKKVINEAGIVISEGAESDDDIPMESELMKSKIEILKKSSSVVQTSRSFPTEKQANKKQALNKDCSILPQAYTPDRESSVNSIDNEFLKYQENALKQLKVVSDVNDEIDPEIQDAESISDEEVPANDKITDVAEAGAKKVESESSVGSTLSKGWSTKSLVQGITSFTHNLISSNPIYHYDEKCALLRGGDDPYFVKSDDQRCSATKRFLKHFSLSDNEKLISAYPCYLVKGIPTYGKIYLGSNEMCFRSTLPGSSTIMILPFLDIENISKEKGFRFGYSGLVIVIHGHEELFFEFSSHEARDDCEFLLLKQIDMFKKTSTDSSVYPSDASGDESFKLAESATSLASARLRMFENRITSEIGVDVPIIIEDHPLTKTKVKPIKSYKFTLLTIGSRGDVQPYIALGKGLMKEGHKVKIVTHAEFEQWIKSYGIEFGVIAGDPSELMALMVNNPSINYNFIKEAKAKFRTWIDDLLVSSWNACQDTDVLIESPSSICGIHIAEKLQIPYFRAFTMPWTRTRAYPHAFMVPDQKLGGAYNYMTHVAFENGYWRGTSYQINKWRVETLGLRKTTLAAMKQNSVPFLYNMSPAVFPPSVDFAEWVHVTGYWFLNESSTYDPPKELVEFMENARKDGKKLVYIGFGSIVVSNPKELTKAVADAVVESDVRCILNKGWSDRLGNKSGIEVELPKEVYNSGNVPHDWLFPQLDAAVHHGGSGTTGASLRFGLPTIIKPFFGDQKFYAGRVEDLGCGIALKDLNYKTLAKALKEITTNTRIIEKAKSIGTKIRTEHGVQNAIEAIYVEMDYARKLSISKNHQTATIKNDVDGDEMDDTWLLI